MHERVKARDYNLIHTRSGDISADVYTKAFTQKSIWTKLRRPVNIYTPEETKNGDFNPTYEQDKECEEDFEMEKWIESVILPHIQRGIYIGIGLQKTSKSQ